MADVLVEFDTVVTASTGTRWTPRACGRVADDNLWEGWIEFTPRDGGVEPARTGAETKQPNRDDLMYWAQGLTQTFLEGALERAIGPRPRRTSNEIDAVPHFDRPAGHSASANGQSTPRAVLNPFVVYEQGQDILVEQLGALDAGRLRDIAVAYGFASPADVDGANRERLTATIIAGVRRPLAGPAADSEASAR